MGKEGLSVAYQAPDVFQVGEAKELIQGCIGAELDHDLVTWCDISFWHQDPDLERVIPKHSSPCIQGVP